MYQFLIIQNITKNGMKPMIHVSCVYLYRFIKQKLKVKSIAAVTGSQWEITYWSRRGAVQLSDWWKETHQV